MSRYASSSVISTTPGHKLTKQDGSLDTVLKEAVHACADPTETGNQPMPVYRTDSVAEQVVRGSPVPNRKIRLFREVLG